MSYPAAVNLPFNATVIAAGFTPAPPGTADDGAPGAWAVLRGGALVVEERGGALVLPEGERPHWLPAGQEALAIGRWHGRPLRAARMAAQDPLPSPFMAEPFNASGERLDDATLTLGGMAQQVLHWERNSRFCSRCGSLLERLPASWGKRCTPCGVEHFPHIHPCAIVLVKRGDEFLLARKPEWAPGRYGLVAGFLDFGESLEECARREVREETGVEIGAIRYVGSQCWPFPSQLMAGFVAEYAGGGIRVDPAELEDARWFRADAMPASIPPRRSIARWIIDRFAIGDQGPGTKDREKP
jgi:NAD+ diphosphatase